MCKLILDFFSRIRKDFLILIYNHLKKTKKMGKLITRLNTII